MLQVPACSRKNSSVRPGRVISRFNRSPGLFGDVQPTRRYWGAVGLALAVGAAALVAAAPILLVGSAAVLAWLVGAQIAFTHAAARFDGSLVVEQSVDRRRVVIDESVTVTCVVEGDTRGLDVAVRVRPSAGLDTDDDLTGTPSVPVVASVRSPVAGTHELRVPEVTIRDSTGLFVERLQRGPTVEIGVEPREPSRLHVGEGGDAIPAAYGEHGVDFRGSGLIPAELREYVPGEAASRIDWKATARLATPHVREYEAEADVTTVLVFDHRGSLDVGHAGETALAYLRSAALGYLTVARSLGDPVGGYGVADAGVHELAPPSTNVRGFKRLHDQLTALEATGETERSGAASSLSQRSPTLDSDTAFGETLEAFVESGRTVTASPNPLLAAVRSAISGQERMVHVVVFTDDTDRVALLDAVTMARQRNHRVTVFVTPRVFYEPDSLANLRRASERYEEFEAFRKRLAGMEGVRAYEIAPRDRIETLLEAAPQSRA